MEEEIESIDNTTQDKKKDSEGLLSQASESGSLELGDTNKESIEKSEVKSLGRYDKEGYKEITMEKPREIDATGVERPWRVDKNGYFLIRINEELGKIEAAFCDIKENKVRVIVRGDTPMEIYTAILKEDLISMLDHAADLGVELEKAYIALKTGKKYTQDRVDLED